MQTLRKRMKLVNHCDGGISITLSPEECEKLFHLIREGRKAIVSNNENYDSKFALDFMRVIS